MQEDRRGKKKTPWTEPESLIVSHYWGLEDGRQIGLRLGRTPASVRAKVKDMGLPLHPRTRPWTSSEVKRFKEVYPIVGGACAKSFGRTLYSVRKMSQHLKIKVAKLGGKPHQLKGKILPSGIKILEFIESNPRRGYIWLFECHCGNFGKAPAYRLYRGITRSCGCLNLKTLPGPRFDARRSKNKGASKYNKVKCQSEQLKSIQRRHELYSDDLPDIEF